MVHAIVVFILIKMLFGFIVSDGQMNRNRVNQWNLFIINIQLSIISLKKKMGNIPIWKTAYQNVSQFA